MSAGGVNSNRVPRGKYTLTQFVLTCILSDMPSLSDSSSARFLVPRTFLRVVWASSRVDECALDTLATAEMGQCMRKYTTPSTATVTESLVRICKVKMLQLWCCHYSDHNMTDCFFINERDDLCTGESQMIKCNKKTHKQRTSCGGMSKDTVLRSTFTKLSVQGRTKKSPGKMQRPCFYFLYPVNRCFSNLDHPILEKLLFFYASIIF